MYSSAILPYDRPTAEPHHDVTELRAPKLAVPRQHQFTGIELESEFDKGAAAAPRELVGPVYDTEAANNYREVVKHADAVK